MEVLKFTNPTLNRFCQEHQVRYQKHFQVHGISGWAVDPETRTVVFFQDFHKAPSKEAKIWMEKFGLKGRTK